MAVYEWLIGTRYLRSTHRRGFVSFVALMSVCGLTLGVATLIVVLSVMNGFERELRSRILAVTAHATLSGLSGSLADWRAQGLRILQSITDMDFGRTFVALDPDGHRLRAYVRTE